MAYPDCALALAFEGVSLRRRRADGWIAQGQALFDAPDMRTALEKLRARATGPDTNPLAPVLLVLPRDQVLYRRLRPRHSGPDGASAVREALEGQTPYPVDKLRFSFERLANGGIAYAAVALETLEEAEGFARANGFDPRGVMAPPREGLIDTPAWFGTSTQEAPDGWLARPELVDWAVATEDSTLPARPDAVRFATARANAHDVARQVPPLRETAPPEIYTAHEEARISQLLRKTTSLARVKAGALRALWMGGSLVAVLGGLVLWLDRPAPTTDVVLDGSQEQAALSLPIEDIVQDAPAVPAPRPDPLADAAPLDIEEADFWTPERGLMRPAEITGLDALVQPSLDPPLGADALALELPDPDTGAPDLAVLTPPPAPQERFDIDAAGLVRPEPDGAATPEGFLVFEGRPPLLPSARPDEVAEAHAAAETLAEETPPEAQQASEDTVLPRRRPTDLVARFERSAFGGRTRTELATLRPTPRRAEVAAAAAASRAVQTAAVDAALASAQAAALVRPGASDPRPAPRPKTLRAPSNSQQRAVAAVAAASTATVASAPAKVEREIETAYVEPTRSSNKTVVKQATANRINLKDVNLLGTFGPTSAQRALVRLPSGRVINVEVGDRVDGGRVSAIGRGELRYTKGGRAHVLKMPRG
ncbi:MAG: hypothetical protein NXH97_06260 [Rhodobacteraceae bacterium]|nr:hypothetical protein [Paracoccaceae bacterium]